MSHFDIITDIVLDRHIILSFEFSSAITFFLHLKCNQEKERMQYSYLLKTVLVTDMYFVFRPFRARSLSQHRNIYIRDQSQRYTNAANSAFLAPF